jgi:hypothetical protein
VKAYLETTEWKADYRVPNNVYLLDGDWLHAMLAEGSKAAKWFTKPIRIDRRGRKFQEVSAVQFGSQRPAEITTITVVGSKGNSYQVDPAIGTCTCPGFAFRGNCKHVKELAKN